MSDVVVVGGGIVGCACAYELAKRGARVTLLEYGKTGMQATNAAAGILAPLADADAVSPLTRAGMRALHAYPAVVEELEARAGFGVELRLGGVLSIAFDGEQMKRLARRHAWQRELGLAVQRLDASTCRELEPRLSDRVLGGVFSESDGSVSNQLVTLALERAAVALGAEFRERMPVTGFATKGDRVVGVRSGATVIPCDSVVIAAGARSAQIAAKLRAPLPVRPVRGQMIALGGMVTPVQHVIWAEDGYLVPRANGLVFAGATVEEVGFRRRTTRAGIRRLRAMANRLVPQLRAAMVHFDWAGLRPGTPDNLPIIGPLAAWRNAAAATGHYRSGILLGPLTGEWVARGIVDGDWSDVPPEFAPARFT